MATKSPSLVDKHVASRIRLCRLQKGISQEQLAEALGITFQQIQKYEKGANRISAGRLQEVSRALSTPITFFYSEGSQAEEPELSDESVKMAELITSPEVVYLLRTLAPFDSPRIWRSIAQLVTAIIEEFDRKSSPEDEEPERLLG